MDKRQMVLAASRGEPRSLSIWVKYLFFGYSGIEIIIILRLGLQRLGNDFSRHHQVPINFELIFNRLRHYSAYQGAPLPLIFPRQNKIEAIRLPRSGSQAWGMPAALHGDFCHQKHLALVAKRALRDIDPGELEHHLLKGGIGLGQLRRQFEQTPYAG